MSEQEARDILMFIKYILNDKEFQAYLIKFKCNELQNVPVDEIVDMVEHASAQINFTCVIKGRTIH